MKGNKMFKFIFSRDSEKNILLARKFSFNLETKKFMLNQQLDPEEGNFVNALSLLYVHLFFGCFFEV